jgi:hypothetical protein
MTLSTDSTTPPDDALPPDGIPETDDIEAIDDIELIDDVELIEVTEAPAPVVPDRADAPVSEIAERFLKVVLAHVPLDRIEELHLFSPLRQGGVETGIAVIAARVPVVVVEPTAVPELPFDDAAVEDALVEVDMADALVEDLQDGVELEGELEGEVEGELEGELVVDDDVVEDIGAADVPAEAELLADADDVAVIETTPVPRIRHTVYTARYRLVQKGPERGKWEADVVAEAEAPLITVDLVVRGVQRRAGEESEIVRYSAPQLARALRVPFPAA